ncbi:MAG: NAD(P)/FAD-dependent oxidoreductase [Pseudomonadota bacterium]
MDRFEVIVVGAGVVGLAIARRLARDGHAVLIVEAEDAFGTITSARNSEVIHAGIYYPQGSLKAALCVRGRELLYEYCSSRGIPHRRTGKWIVATRESQVPELEAIARKAELNGVHDLRPLESAEAANEEPQLRSVAGLVSPSTGIIDSHAYMLSLLGEAEDAGALLALRTRLMRARIGDNGIEASFDGDESPTIAARWLINSAGLDAPDVAARIEGFPQSHCRRAYYAKGNYFSLSGPTPFKRLIYPIPEPGGLGVHVTLDMAGRARFGPDVEWVDRPHYMVDPDRAKRFYPVIRSYWPGLPDGALVPAYAGVRPKICGPAEPAADFTLEGPAAHGVPGVINLLGIESPGLTASLALAERVADIVVTQAGA